MTNPKQDMDEAAMRCVPRCKLSRNPSESAPIMTPSPRVGASPFIVGTTLQWAIDSSSLSVFKACQRKYFYEIIEGWRSNEQSVHLVFGGAFASSLECFAKRLASGTDREDCIDDAISSALQRTWFGRDVDGNGAEIVGTGRPWESNHSAKTRETLIRSLVWYFEQYADDPVKTVTLADGKAAVELSFQLDLERKTPSGRNYILCGHLDKLAEFGDSLFIQDQKTSGSTISAYFFRKFSPDTQMTLYTLAAKVVFNTPVSGVMIDAAQIAVGFTAFARSITTRTEGQLNEFLESLEKHWLPLMEKCAAEGYYPMNEASCQNFGGCQFIDVCSKDPALRENFLRATFTQKDPWNPLQSRET